MPPETSQNGVNSLHCAFATHSTQAFGVGVPDGPEQTAPPSHVPGSPASSPALLQAPSAEHASSVQGFPSSQWVAVVHATQTAVAPAPTQCGVPTEHPASVPSRSVSAQVTQALLGPPEQTSPSVQVPGRPASTGVVTQAPAAEQPSTVHAPPSSHCEAPVHWTQRAAAPVPTQYGVASAQPMSTPSADVSMQLATVNVTSGVAALVVPESVCVAVIVCEPGVNGVVGVHEKAPSAHVATHTVASPSRTVTVAPGAQAPTIAGVGLVTLPPVGAVIEGGPSTKKLRTGVAALVVPASVCVAVIACGPGASGLVGVQP